MKILQCLLIVSFLFVSCDKDDDSNDNQDNNIPNLEGTDFKATIDGGDFSDYDFNLGAYTITTVSSNSTMSIDVGDLNGEQITLFLNATGGFDSGTVKQMNNVDADNYRTYGLFRQSSPQMSYYSSEGSVTITENKVHPTESGVRLISGNFDISAATIDDTSNIEMTGAFSELEYTE
ncbi:hypothetical protein [Sediminibacter sp. Hel_I_10]|uniref:hypothetical protein n=1 Tax=Sediminibacter sp. Hel_I_10 TaxID=1392490 RepID=UPI0012DC477C|nr:hypothetical protein [Sediminibacter sp. Hel_I_10]